MIRILFVASNPADTELLHLDEEIRSITQRIGASPGRDRLELKALWAARPDDLLQGLNETRPQIVHFSGHGDGGEIVLTDRNRQAKPVSVEALQRLFAAMQDNLRVVVLNACYSAAQAAALAEIIECVVGMGDAVDDEAAILFAASFYRAIGFGRSVAEAFAQGKAAIGLEGLPDVETPQLLHRSGVDPARVILLADHPNGNRKSDLVTALMACESMRDRKTRDTIVDQLPAQIRSTIRRSDVDRVDVINIVSRCQNYARGVEELAEILRTFEGDSLGMQQVDVAIAA